MDSIGSSPRKSLEGAGAGRTAPPRLFADLRAAFYSRRLCMKDYEKRTSIRLGKGTCDALCRNER